jgi:hypothetical protein
VYPSVARCDTTSVRNHIQNDTTARLPPRPGTARVEPATNIARSRAVPDQMTVALGWVLGRPEGPRCGQASGACSSRPRADVRRPRCEPDRPRLQPLPAAAVAQAESPGPRPAAMAAASPRVPAVIHGGARAGSAPRRAPRRYSPAAPEGDPKLFLSPRPEWCRTGAPPGIGAGTHCSDAGSAVAMCWLASCSRPRRSSRSWDCTDRR